MRKIYLTASAFLFGSISSLALKEYLTCPDLLKANAVTLMNNSTPALFPIPNYNYPSKSDLKVYNRFVVSYNRQTRNPDWVMEYLTPQSVGLPSDNPDFRKDLPFEFDETEHPLFRSLSSDYFNSGYDRGHLAAAANYKNEEGDLRRSFVMSNISPQVGENFNRGIWNKLESFTRALVRRNEYVIVWTGPLYLPKPVGSKMFVQYEVIGKNNVAVPTHFFKVLLIKEPNRNSFKLFSYILPNQPLLTNGNFNLFYVPIVDIERAAGFIILSDLLKYLKMSQINEQQIQ